MAAVSGFVRDPEGAPAVRSLRLYRRDTGELLDSTDSAGGPAIPGDANYDKVALLLHCDGANLSTVFLDKSSAPKTVAVTGAAKITTAQSKWGGSSLILSGLDSDLSIASLLASTDHFCMEAWVRLNATDAGGQYHHPIFGQGGSAGSTDQFFGIYVESAARSLKLAMFRGTGLAGAVDLSGGTIVPREQWVHCALTYDGKLRGFLDGVKQFEQASSVGWLPTSSNLRIGRSLVMGYEQYRSAFQGCLDDIRITRGIARYTANFTPPITPFAETLNGKPERAVGEYYMQTAYAGEVQVVCLDDDGNILENDRILRTYPV